VTSERLLEALERGCWLMEQMKGEGTPDRGINCALIPDKEVVFFVQE